VDTMEVVHIWTGQMTNIRPGRHIIHNSNKVRVTNLSKPNVTNYEAAGAASERLNLY